MMNKLLKRFAKWILRKEIQEQNEKIRKFHSEVKEFVEKVEDAAFDDDKFALLELAVRSAERRGLEMKLEYGEWEHKKDYDFGENSQYKVYTVPIELKYEAKLKTN